MEKEQGLQIIEQALNLANSKGIFKLEESATVFAALTAIKTVSLEPLPEPKLEKEVIRTKSK
jgi:hypothetical protein